MMKSISIIIPIRNEEKYINACIESIVNFDYPKYLLEVIFVDGMSEDNTVNIIELYQENYSYIKIIDNKDKIVPVSMNVGIKEAKGEYIVRLDAHAKYPKNYISKLLEWSQKLNADNVGAVCITDIRIDTFVSRAIKFVMSDKFGVGNSLFRVGVKNVTKVDTVPFGFYKRSVFNKIGLYDERLVRVQDLELNKRLRDAGGKIYLVPDVKCTYYPRETFLAFFKNRFLTGRWVILAPYLTKNLGRISVRHLVPLVFTLLLTSSIFINIYLFLFLLGSYSMILFIRSLFLNKKIILSFYIVVTYFTLHFSYGLGSISGLISIIKNKIL